MAQSKPKGDNFERAIAKIFGEALGLDLRRTPLSGGWARGNPGVSGDIVCVDPGPDALPYNIECKNSEGWRLESLFIGQHKWFDEWWAQAVRECPTGKTPLLVFSRAYCPIFVAFPLNVLMEAVDPLGYGYKEWNIPFLRLTEQAGGGVIMLLDDFLDFVLAEP